MPGVLGSHPKRKFPPDTRLKACASVSVREGRDSIAYSDVREPCGRPAATAARQEPSKYFPAATCADNTGSAQLIALSVTQSVPWFAADSPLEETGFETIGSALNGGNSGTKPCS
jgi:hypothetical protein